MHYYWILAGVQSSKWLNDKHQCLLSGKPLKINQKKRNESEENSAEQDERVNNEFRVSEELEHDGTANVSERWLWT